MTKAREAAAKLERELAGAKESEPSKTAAYDCQELFAFILILILSVIPSGFLFARAYVCSAT
jgi:hypothetical protein